jgi:hypothetical protein
VLTSDVTQHLRDIREADLIYAEEGLAHLDQLLRLGNLVLRQNAVLPPIVASTRKTRPQYRFDDLLLATWRSSDVEAYLEELPSASGSSDPILAARKEATPEPGVPLLHADSVPRSRFKRLMTENSRMRRRSGVNITRSTLALPLMSTPRKTAPGA